MKSIITLGVVGAIVVSGVQGFAMTSPDSSMMMKSDSMMKMEGSMSMNSSMTKMDYSKQSVMTIATHYGYNWKRDRVALAKLAGVTGYRGTLAQNLRIKAFLLSLKSDAVMVGGQMMVRSQDIVDNAVRASNVTTVVAAVKAAGLVDTLKSAGPFTVFAPNNAAFAALPAGTVETLLKPENKGTLVDILTYHVVSGKYKSSDLTDGLVLTTVEGKTLTFTRVNGKLMINGSAMVETADVISSNGVTHVIDTVLMPK